MQCSVQSEDSLDYYSFGNYDVRLKYSLERILTHQSY